MNATDIRAKVRELLDYEALNQMFFMTSRERAEFQDEVMKAMDIDRNRDVFELLNRVMNDIIDFNLDAGVSPADIAKEMSARYDMPIRKIQELSGVRFLV